MDDLGAASQPPFGEARECVTNWALPAQILTQLSTLGDDLSVRSLNAWALLVAALFGSHLESVAVDEFHKHFRTAFLTGQEARLRLRAFFDVAKPHVRTKPRRVAGHGALEYGIGAVEKTRTSTGCPTSTSS